MTTYQGKPHIRRRSDGSAVVEYRVPNLRALPTVVPQNMVGAQPGGWFTVLESSPGAWQRNIVGTAPQSMFAFSAVYACVSLIAGDISKLRLRLMEDAGDGTWREVNDGATAFLPVLRKPNAYQTRLQFFTAWLSSKLNWGNAYVLKERDGRNVVVALYPLDPCRVRPLVADNGDVYYRLCKDYLAGLDEEDIVVPASEIIHDRMITFAHPLVGVSPLFACGVSALQGISIQNNSQAFFANMSRPSGILVAPTKLDNAQAERIRERWQQNFGPGKAGGVAVLENGLKYEPFTMSPVDAQLVEQLKMSVEDVCRAFHVPVYKVGLQANMTLGNSAQYDQDYYTQCLQVHIESIEILMDEALGLEPDRRTEFDLDGLLRMDPLGQAEANAKQIGAGALAPNEARRRMNLPPVPGGDACYLQQQNFSTAALERRDALPDPFGKSGEAQPAPPSAPAPPARESEVEMQKSIEDAARVLELMDA